MITVRNKQQSYEVDANFDDFVEELNNTRTPFIQINGEMMKKSEVTGVKKGDKRSANIPQFEADMLPLEKRNENIYVYTYLKAHIPRHMKELGRRLTTEEIRAVVAEARVAYND